ncbi:MAG: alkylhydroperoxidase [Rhodospirillaceae bacterium]|nr:alkylhydroperoxidase [Rhodospirillaceae bacterium]OUT76502.1 MAG: alkylhydroperoxidase [Rhodospirillaceae bacterium TMED23]|tara:strand:+ start:33198 stop:33785 length:588 start_codon:yes stop_codon:yes gene_type:complete
MSAWIKMIEDNEADADLLGALNLSRSPHGTVDNVLRVHSLRPNTMRGHISLYKACLHDDGNTLPTWLQETISSYVSVLNKCDYSLANHWANARYLINNQKRANAIEKALHDNRPQDVFIGAELAILQYAEKLTINPTGILKSDVDRLKKVGFDDGQILEANQIICYFNYVNRCINGLGVTTEGDIVGYYDNSNTE